MKKLIALMALLSGCTTAGVYDSEKTWIFIGGVVVVGAIAAASADSGAEPHRHGTCGWVVGPNGSTPIPC